VLGTAGEAILIELMSAARNSSQDSDKFAKAVLEPNKLLIPLNHSFIFVI